MVADVFPEVNSPELTFAIIFNALKKPSYCATVAGGFPSVDSPVCTFAVVVCALAVGAEGGECWVSHGRTDLAGLAPGVRESLDHEAAAAGGLGHHHRQRVQAPPVLYVRVAQTSAQIWKVPYKSVAVPSHPSAG